MLLAIRAVEKDALPSPRCRPRSDSSRATRSGPALAVGAVPESRAQAIAQLEGVATFFATAEPSSPIPMFVRQLTDLVGKSFGEILASVAPSAVEQVQLKYSPPKSSAS